MRKPVFSLRNTGFLAGKSPVFRCLATDATSGGLVRKFKALTASGPCGRWRIVGREESHRSARPRRGGERFPAGTTLAA